MLRAVKPARVVEVGAGVSTAVALAALSRNGSGTITCIEPYPRAALRRLPITLVESPVQSVPQDYFTTLQAGDVLFIDSTHVVRVGGDVNLIVLEILPRLSPGVLVHFHDIYLPYDYPPDLFASLWSWNETSLIRAYLWQDTVLLKCFFVFRHSTTPILSALADIFPEYRPRRMVNGLYSDEGPNTQFPASLWLRVGERLHAGGSRA